MSKYLHEYNAGRCRHCGETGKFEPDEQGELIKVADLMRCKGCNSVQYCCKEHQLEDWKNHKKFCRKFKKLIAEYKLARDSRPPGTPKPAKPTPYPLHDLVEKGDWRGLSQFLTDHPRYDVNEMHPGQKFMSPLLLACGQGQIECVHVLLDRGANFKFECEESNLTPLQYASWWGHDDIVQLLLNRGADVNQTNVHGTFALGYAAQKLQPHVVKLLLRYGANFEQRNIMGWTPLMATVCMGETALEGGIDSQTRMEDNPKIIRIVKILLEAGADINARGQSSFGVVDFRGDTALSLAGEADKIDIMEFLISEGALLDVQRESDGMNALLTAAECNEHEVVQLLIRSGADITARDHNGRDYRDLLELPWPRVEVDEVVF